MAASLVQGVKILERDRQEKRQGPQALAPPWWEFFQFQMVRQLVDDVDSSIFGAIYEFKPPTSPSSFSTCENPHYVIAFRGTIMKRHSVLRDLKLDLRIVLNSLHQTSCFEIAMQAVRNMVAANQDKNIWLSGHSLGSSIAMLAGKNMAKTGIFLEAFLFNPPFFSAPIERIKDKKVKEGLRIASSVMTAGLAVAIKGTHQRNRFEDPFVYLSTWSPSLFVNPADHICSEYIGYFEHREKMKDIGAGGIERLATQNSILGLFKTAMGKESEPPLHLIPSAALTINSNRSPDSIRPHGIHQWWGPDSHFKFKLYRYN